MRNCLTLITFILCLSLQMANLHAQNRPVSTDNPPPPPGEFDPEMIYDFVSEFPTFPGGNNAKLEFINENLRYPQECIDKGIQGIVWLKVVIDKKGNIIKNAIFSEIDNFNVHATSTLAGDYKFGSTNIDMTLKTTAYIVKIGFHFSYNFYCGFIGSSTGRCKIDIHTSPFG